MKHIKLILFALLLCLASGAKSQEAKKERIISLSPNMTEILYALGAEELLVGVTDQCDYPIEVKKKKSKVGAMASPSLEAIVRLRPTLVFQNREGNPKEIADKLLRLNIKTHTFKANRLEELPAGIIEVGRSLQDPIYLKRAEAIAKQLTDNYQSYKRESEKKTPAVQALFIIWQSPLLVAGGKTLMSDAMELLGLKNIADSSLSSYPHYSLEAIVRESPQIIFIGQEHGSSKELTSLKKIAKRSLFCPVSDRLYRAGPRVTEGIAELAACIKKLSSSQL